MTTLYKLGRMEKVDLRVVWSSEAGDFTPWLALDENLKLLGETIGLNLELETTEKYVGPFRADILCKDAFTDSWVLIENQLERTDHSHLGQLLTYAAGLNTVTIIWIAQRFTEEHRAALDWLNEVTDEHINFFGLEIELWRIGLSDVAPKFNVISQPNNWTKQAAAAKQVVETSENSQLRLEFWTEFQRYLEDKGSFLRSQKPSTEYWTNFALGRSNFTLSALVGMRDGYLGVSLVLTGPNAKAHYHLLTKSAGAIEEAIGENLFWRELPENKQSDVSIYWRGAEPSNREKWSEQFEWLRTRLEKFHQTFAPLIKSLNAADYQAPVVPSDGASAYAEPEVGSTL